MNKKTQTFLSKNDQKLVKAMDIVTRSLREDPGLYLAWQSNIAMAFVDEVGRRRYINHRDLGTVSNQAAKNFLNLLTKK